MDKLFLFLMITCVKYKGDKVMKMNENYLWNLFQEVLLSKY